MYKWSFNSKREGAGWKALCILNSHSLFNSDDNVNYASRWQRCQKKWRRHASRLSSCLHLEWQAAKTGRQAVRQAAVEQCGNCKWNCLTGCHREWIMLPTRSAVEKWEGVSSHHNMPPWKCIKFTPLRNKHERTRECLTILMSIKRLICMHHHQQQRKVPISAPLFHFLSLYLYI